MNTKTLGFLAVAVCMSVAGCERFRVDGRLKVLEGHVLQTADEKGKLHQWVTGNIDVLVQENKKIQFKQIINGKEHKALMKFEGADFSDDHLVVSAKKSKQPVDIIGVGRRTVVREYRSTGYTSCTTADYLCRRIIVIDRDGRRHVEVDCRGEKYVEIINQDIHHAVTLRFFEPVEGRTKPNPNDQLEIAEVRADRNYTDRSERDITDCRPIYRRFIDHDLDLRDVSENQLEAGGLEVETRAVQEQ